MGERERKDSMKVLKGERIVVGTRFGFLDFLLYPYRAWKEKKRQEALRKRIVASISCETGYEGTDQKDQTKGD